MSKYKFFEDNVLEQHAIPCVNMHAGNVLFSEIHECLKSENIFLYEQFIPMMFDIFIRVMFAEPCLDKDNNICMLNILINEDTTLKEIDPEEFAKSDQCEMIRTAFEKMANGVMSDKYYGSIEPGKMNIHKETFPTIIKEFTLAFNDIMQIGRDARKKYGLDWHFEFAGEVPANIDRTGFILFTGMPIVIKKKDGTEVKANGVAICSSIAIPYFHKSEFIGNTFGIPDAVRIEAKKDA